MRNRKGIGLVVLTAILLLSGCQNLPGPEETVPAKGPESQEEMPTEMDLPIETQEEPVMENMPAEPGNRTSGKRGKTGRGGVCGTTGRKSAGRDSAGRGAGGATGRTAG